jgi:hypothetical protein
MRSAQTKRWRATTHGRAWLRERYQWAYWYRKFGNPIPADVKVFIEAARGLSKQFGFNKW